MPVLVVGATGFIGPRLIRRLVARGESVVGMDLNPGAATFGDVPIGAPVIRGDVTSFEDVMRTVLDVKPDRLINLAYGLGAGEGNPIRSCAWTFWGWTTASKPRAWPASSAWSTRARSR